MFALTIASPKGGVGKTTVALNLGYALARRGWRTVVVDTDPQGAIALSLSKNLTRLPGVAEYAAQLAPAARLVVDTKLPELKLIPVGRVAVDDAVGFGAALADGRALQDLVADLEGRHDVIVFDTPSGFVGPTVGALRASDGAIGVVQAEPIAARSALRVFEMIRALEEGGSPVRLLGLLVTMLQARDTHSLEVAEELWKSLPSETVLEMSIPRDPIFLEASAAGVPVGLLSRRAPPAALLFEQLAAEVEQRAPLAGKDETDGPISLVD